MKLKLLFATLFLLLFGLPSHAQQILQQSQVYAATSTLNNGIFEGGQNVAAVNVKWQTSGTVSTCTFTIDTAPDNATWSVGGAVASTTCTASSGSVTVYNLSPANYHRINLSTLTGGGTITITYTGFINSLASGQANVQVFSTGSITPVATSAAIQTVAQAFAVTGILATDKLVILTAPTPTSLCPLTSIVQNGAGSVNLFWTVLTAAACTPAAGTYTFMALR